MAEEQPPQPSESDQELIEQLQAELRRLKVADLLVQTLYSVSSLGYHRLSGEGKDLDQARLAIEAMKALPWSTLASLKGDRLLLQKLEEAEALIRSLRKTLRA